MKYYHFDGLLLKTGFLSPAYVGVRNGIVTHLSSTPGSGSATSERVHGYIIPGFQNAHSHAFQYVMAGMAERHAPGTSDDFWTWREAMYRCALTMDPDEMESIATMLYAEMVRHGYTHVAEFHYLHHDKNGHPYNNLSEMGERLVRAAQHAGIRITLVPIFYQKGNFGTQPYLQQRRFISTTVDEYLKLLQASASAVSAYNGAHLGFGVHSLRAVNETDIKRLYENGPPELPFHLHAAEQLKEVDDCIRHLKKRPVQWLLDNLPMDNRFHLVHCTHLDDSEVSGLAASGAHVILCPGTEANLGDGIFRLGNYSAKNGRWSIGTDSQISLNPLEDLRWMDYVQRLMTHKRNTFDDGAGMIVDMTLNAGRMAMGQNDLIDYFQIGKPFDGVVFNSQTPLLVHRSAQDILPLIFYTSDSSSISGTIVGGEWIVKNGLHRSSEEITIAYAKAVKSLHSEKIIRD